MPTPPLTRAGARSEAAVLEIALGDAATTRQMREHFERGLDIILTGIRADLQP
jgi:hypothetical protein